MAVEIAPHFAVNHFTLGNVYVAMVSLGRGQLSPHAELDFKAYFESVTLLQVPRVFSPKLASTLTESQIHRDLRGCRVVVEVVVVLLMLLFGVLYNFI